MSPVTRLVRVFQATVGPCFAVISSFLCFRSFLYFSRVNPDTQSNHSRGANIIRFDENMNKQQNDRTNQILAHLQGQYKIVLQELRYLHFRKNATSSLACEEDSALRLGLRSEETLLIAHIALVDVIYPKKAKQTPGWFQSGYVCSHEAAVSLFSPLRGFTAFWLIMSSGARSGAPPRLYPKSKTDPGLVSIWVCLLA